MTFFVLSLSSPFCRRRSIGSQSAVHSGPGKSGWWRILPAAAPAVRHRRSQVIRTGEEGRWHTHTFNTFTQEFFLFTLFIIRAPLELPVPGISGHIHIFLLPVSAIFLPVPGIFAIDGALMYLNVYNQMSHTIHNHHGWTFIKYMYLYITFRHSERCKRAASSSYAL